MVPWEDCKSIYSCRTWQNWQQIGPSFHPSAFCGLPRQCQSRMIGFGRKNAWMPNRDILRCMLLLISAKVWNVSKFCPKYSTQTLFFQKTNHAFRIMRLTIAIIVAKTSVNIYFNFSPNHGCQPCLQLLVPGNQSPQKIHLFRKQHRKSLKNTNMTCVIYVRLIDTWGFIHSTIFPTVRKNNIEYTIKSTNIKTNFFLLKDFKIFIPLNRNQPVFLEAT